MNYWQERTLKAQQELSNRNIKQIEKQMRKYYSISMKKILGSFEKTYNKLLLSMSEGKEPTPADLYKLDTYWQAQAQLRQELRELGERQTTLLSKQFELHFFDIYFSIAIQGEEAFSTIDTAIVQQMINQIWVADGKSWSQRIWDNTELLQEALNANLITCVVTGKKTTELINLLQNDFGVSYNRADALVRTEISHIQNQAAQKRYQDYGIQEFEVWADEDERRCDVCGKLHEKRYPMGAVVPIPAHPRCRCSIIPVVE
jgi:SPP1 gp7 family putative phage head morphogenesis protein